MKLSTGRPAILSLLFLMLSYMGMCQLSRPDTRFLDSVSSISQRHSTTTKSRQHDFNSRAQAQLKTILPQLTQQTLHNARPLRNQFQNAASASLAPGPDVCFDTSGRYFLKDDTLTYFVNTSLKLTDGDILVAGECANAATGNNSRGFLIKCNDTGTVQWTRWYDSLNNKSWSYFAYYRLLELQDGSLLLGGLTINPESQNDDILLTHTDNTGNIIWSKTYKSRLWSYGNGSGDYFYLQQLVQDPQSGDIFFNSGHWSAGYNVTRIGVSDGSVAWSRFYQIHNTYNFDRPFGLDVRGNEIISFSKFLRYDGNTIISIYRLNKNTGDTLSTRFHSTVDPSNINYGFLGPEKVVRLHNGNYAITGKMYKYYYWPNDNTPFLTHAGVAEFTPGGDFVKAYCFKNNIESNNSNTRLTLQEDGSGLFSMAHVFSGYVADVYYVQFKNGQILNQRKRNYVNEGLPIEPAAIRTDDGSDLIIKLIGDPITRINKIELLKINTVDTGSNCLGWKDQSTFIESFAYEPFSWGLDSIPSDDVRESRNKTLRVRGTIPDRLPACRQVSYCDTISLIISADTICTGSTVIVKVRKNPACGAQALFDYDATIINLTEQLNDSMYVFTSVASGHTTVYASIMGCALMTDSVSLTILRSGGPVHLGTDTIICPGNELALHAGEGYATYEWQDGSSGELLKVTASGMYHVAVMDSCGNIFRDTIIVNPHPPIPFDAGNDIVLCQYDTVTLTAPTSFINYQWTPNYHINSQNRESVRVFPLQDTAYYIQAEKTPGCFVYDTILVQVNTAPSIDLGNAAQFCAGDSITLDAGSGFNYYQWNNGSRDRFIKVFKEGRYIIKATASNGCHSSDTFTVARPFPKPMPFLGSDGVLCTGSSRPLDAGQYVSYSWSTGSTSRSIRVDHTGTYSVQVTDNNCCKGGDTLVVTQIIEPPSDFLQADTTICNYAIINMTPAREYSSYLWSNNSRNPNISINAGGVYWLEVTDQHNCSGRDSVVISIKECLKGFFVPNAFTPGKTNGKNSQFRPMIFGNLIKYEFTVFNRWGQPVYKTTDIQKAWDGSYKGIPQSTEAFAWSCRYQLAGEAVKEERGVVVLIQ